jgi:hypothetical protein
MFTRKYYRWAARAISLTMVIAGAVLAPTPASLTWLAGMGMTFVFGLLPGLLH